MSPAQLTLVIVAASYVVSAAMLAWMKRGGADVPTWFTVGWLLTGLIGIVASLRLDGSRHWAWWVALLALGPWMTLSLVWDIRHASWWMAALDIAGLIAIAWGLWSSR